MRLIYVESPNIKAIGYDGGTSELLVEFRSGKTAIYHDVPASVFAELEAAPSKGSFINRRVKGIYRYHVDSSGTFGEDVAAVAEADRPEGLYVIFDGPPSHESGRFVEVETADGKGRGPEMTGADWSERPNGMWALGPFQKREDPTLAEELQHVGHHGCISGDCPHNDVHDCRATLIVELERIASVAKAAADAAKPHGAPAHDSEVYQDPVRITVEHLAADRKEVFEFDQLNMTETLGWEEAPESVLDDPQEPRKFTATGDHRLTIHASLSTEARAKLATQLAGESQTSPKLSEVSNPLLAKWHSSGTVRDVYLELVDKTERIDAHLCSMGDCSHTSVHDCCRAFADELGYLASLATQLARTAKQNQSQGSDSADNNQSSQRPDSTQR